MATFAPGHRLAYERDGSAVYRYNADGSPNHPASTAWRDLNDESNSSLQVNGNGARLAVQLAVPITLVGVYASWTYSTDNAVAGSVHYSLDSTNGQDGTWTQLFSSSSRNLDVPVTYRTSIVTANVAGVKAIAFRSDTSLGINLRAMHVYEAAQQTYLKVWDPTTDVEIPHGLLDWETVYAGETYKKQFRIKNIRSMQANNVSVDVTTYTDQTPSISSAYSFSLDDVTYSRPLNIGNVAAGATSPLIYAKLALPSTQTVTLYATQIHGIPGSWT